MAMRNRTVSDLVVCPACRSVAQRGVWRVVVMQRHGVVFSNTAVWCLSDGMAQSRLEQTLSAFECKHEDCGSLSYAQS